MCSAILKFALTLLAVLVGSIGVFLITFRTQALNSDVYKTTLEQSGMYTVIKDQLERQLLPNPDNEESQGAYVFLDPILDNLDIESLIKKTAETNIDNIFAWLKDEQSELTVYFPKQELLDSYNREEVIANVMTEFDTRIADLPECNQQQLNEIIDSDSEEFQLPSCRPQDQTMITEMRQELRTAVSETLGEENFVQTALNEAGLGDVEDNVPLTTLLENQEGGNPAETLEQLKTAKNYVVFSQTLGFILIGATILLVLVVVLIGQISLKRFISVPSTVFLLIGLILILIGVASQAVPNLIIGNLPLPQDNPELLGVNETAVSIVNTLVPKLFELTLYTGVAVFTVSLLLRIAAFLIKSPPKPEPKKETNAKPQMPKKTS